MAANLIMIRGYQSILYFVDRLQLYNYHKTDYDGIFYATITFVNEIKQRMWGGFSFITVTQWFNQPYDLDSYQAYTDDKFLYVERNDCLFVQNTKEFCFITLPLTFIVFLILNRVHSCTKNNKKINYLIGVYRFWFQLLYTLVMNNFNRILFYG